MYAPRGRGGGAELWLLAAASAGKIIRTVCCVHSNIAAAIYGTNREILFGWSATPKLRHAIDHHTRLVGWLQFFVCARVPVHHASERARARLFRCRQSSSSPHASRLVLARLSRSLCTHIQRQFNKSTARSLSALSLGPLLPGRPGSLSPLPPLLLPLLRPLSTLLHAAITAFLCPAQQQRLTRPGLSYTAAAGAAEWLACYDFARSHTAAQLCVCVRVYICADRVYYVVMRARMRVLHSFVSIGRWLEVYTHTFVYCECTHAHAT